MPSKRGHAFGRRALLSGGGAFFLSRVAVPQLLAWAIGGVTRKAAAGPQATWNYVNVHVAGGPNRWGFDQWLKVQPGDPLLPNPHVATAFNGGATSYETFTSSGLEIPHLFELDVATGTGGRRPALDLIQRMAVIRGFSTGADGHSTNHARQTQPIPGGISLGGLVADSASKAISAIVVSNGNDAGIGYHSARGLGQTKLQQLSTLARELMGPFDATSYTLSSDLGAQAQAHKAALDRASDALIGYAVASDPAAASLKSDFAGAVALVKNGVKDIDSYWQAAVARYGAAISGSMQPQVLYPDGMPGITTDLATSSPVTSDGTEAFQIGCTDGTARIIPAGFPLASVVANATVSFLAEYFALAEYALVQNLTSSIELPIGFVDGLQMPDPANPAQMVTFGAGADAHATGAGAALLIDTTFYRGVTAALLELMGTLTTKGLFDHTMLHFTGDFSRTPTDGALFHGSDHGFEACAASLFSGNIKGPLLVGNILSAPTANYGDHYPGTWGQAAPIAELGGQAPGPGHVASTIATLMGVANQPWTATPSLLKLQDGQAALAVEPPRTV
jgi:hypothetical protein